MTDSEMPLTMAAFEMRLSYQRVRTMVLIGEITGAKRGSRWFVSRAEVESYCRRTGQPVGRSAT